MKKQLSFLSFMFMALTLVCASSFVFNNQASADENAIKPYSENPRYWQYNNKLTVLLGGTDDDNPFQRPNLKEHLDLLASVGGNYIRNTMSDRKDKGFEVYAFKQLKNGKYDLRKWNPVYWSRFKNMLKLTKERGIIVQIEVWDRFDYSGVGNANRWQIHPYNPKNNINYTYKQSGFAKTYKDHPGANKQHFFYSAPGMKQYDPKYDVFRKFQEAQVKKMLSYSLKYDNVLYCMNNETNAPPVWGQYWMDFIRKEAKAANVEVMVTDMFDAWDIKSEDHHVVYNNPDIYDFIDVSQNNHNKKDVHWNNIQWVRNYISKDIRPLNTVKIYGADTGRFGNSRDGQERFWRNIIGGMAATRFHRPDSGLGLSETAQVHIKSMRMLLEQIDISQCTPDAKSQLLSEREENEAFLTCNQDKQYALFFPNGGSVDLKLNAKQSNYRIQQLDILSSKWTSDKIIQAKDKLTIAPGKEGYFAVVVTKQ